MTSDERRDWTELENFDLSANENLAIGILLAVRTYLREERDVDLRNLSLEEIIDLVVKRELYRWVEAPPLGRQRKPRREKVLVRGPIRQGRTIP